MKRNSIVITQVLVLAGIITAMAGCSKFLDRKPLEATISDYKGGVLDAQIFGIYADLRNSVATNSLGWLDFNSIRDDDAQKGSSSTDGAEINTEFETFKYTKDDWAANEYWNNHFSLINKANGVLYFADSLKLNDEAAMRNRGEAYFFRAYFYFNLVKTYGEVPLFDKYYQTAQGGIKAKAKVPEIYAQIDRDLDSAAKLLPATWVTSSGAGFPGRLTNGAANTLWAQTYLFRQQWADVVRLCQKVIGSGQYALMPYFYEVWKDGLSGAGKNSKESIFEIQSSIGAAGTNDYGGPWGTTQNVRVESGFPDRTWNLGWGWNTPTQNLVDAWDDKDPRKRCTILYSGQFDGGPAQGGYGATLPAYKADFGLDQPYWNKKVYSDPAMRSFTGHITDGNAGWINHRILRYADVILMLAEASNELGDGATAATNLELIRARARNTGTDATAVPYIAFTSQAQMRQAIKNERRFEFAMEGYRFYDLVRWGDALSTLASLGYTNRCRYYPIPQKAIDQSNGVLLQNPEW